MKAILMAISITALIVLFAAPTLHAAGVASSATSQTGMIVGTVTWFAVTPFWLKSRK